MESGNCERLPLTRDMESGNCERLPLTRDMESGNCERLPLTCHTKVCNNVKTMHKRQMKKAFSP